MNPDNPRTCLKDPLVSVVIPAYNRCHTLGRAIESVRMQGIENMEIIVVDDCSTDETVKFINNYRKKDARIQLYVHSQNKGEAGARNTGVRSARGKYIAFLDSDDEWINGKLAAQIEVMEKADDLTAACSTGQYVIDENGNESLVRDWTEKYPVTDLNLLVYGCGVSMGNCFMIRRSVFDEIGYYDENLPIFVDLDWLCRLTSKYTVRKINKPYARYHKAKMRRGEFLENGVKKFVEKNKTYLSGFSKPQQLRIKSQFYNYISLSYLANGPKRAYLASRLKHIMLYPFRNPWTYIQLLGVLLGILTVGMENDKSTVVSESL